MAPRLQPGEKIVYEGGPSWRSILGFYVKGIALTIVAALIVAAVTAVIDGSADSTLVMLVSFGGVALTVLAGFVKRTATRYTVTDQRLHIRRGIISRTVQETKIRRVQNVTYRQSLFQRLLGVGDVDFDTATGYEFEFTFVGVSGPAGVVHTVNTATGAGRRE